MTDGVLPFAIVILQTMCCYRQRSLVLAAPQEARVTGSSAQCTLGGNGSCSYYVHLLPGCSDVRDDGGSTKQSFPFPAEEEKERMQEMERNLVVLRVDHSRRISELENQIATLLSGGGKIYVTSGQADHLGNGNGVRRKSSTAAANDGSVRSDGASSSSLVENRKSAISFKDDEDRGENLLLVQIHKEFSGLRRELLASRRQARNLEVLLADARSRLNRSESTLIRTASRLMEVELKLEETQSEKEKILLQLGDVKRELTGTKAKLSETTRELRNTTSELQRTQKRRRELEAEVEKCNGAKEEVTRRLNKTTDDYNDLNVRHLNLTTEHKRTQALLIECFRGKTAQFCGFEDPKICGFVQDKLNDDLDWIRWKDRTPSALTGPTVDHTCANNKGYYMYFDAKSPGGGHKARMLSARYYGYAEQCVQFYYHMHGRHVGTLNVYTVVPGHDVSPLWRAFGNQGDVWILARMAIPGDVATLGYQVAFEATVDRGYQGDIAVDDFQVFDGQC